MNRLYEFLRRRRPRCGSVSFPLPTPAALTTLLSPSSNALLRSHPDCAALSSKASKGSPVHHRNSHAGRDIKKTIRFMGGGSRA